MAHSYQTFLEQAMRERGPDHPIWEDNGKATGRELGTLCGLHVPEVFQGPCSLRSMTPPEHDAVIKPVQGCSGRGIRPLRWDGFGQYTNLFTGETMTWEAAVSSAMADKHAPRNLKLLERGHPDAMRPPWLLEELILNESEALVCDWKAFVFGGCVEAVFQMVRTPGEKTKQVKWWSRSWDDIGDIAPVKAWKYTPTLEGPHAPDRLTAAFEAVAGLVDSPFIRVDLYEQPGRVVFGEVTPHPTGGSVKFVPKWDRRFGAAWAGAS